MDGLIKKPPHWSDQLYNDVIKVPYDYKCCSCNNRCSILYCACFHYRMYCDESCPCKDDDCWNQAKNEAQIRAIREEIESRIVLPSNLEYDHPKPVVLAQEDIIINEAPATTSVSTAAITTDQDNNTTEEFCNEALKHRNTIKPMFTPSENSEIMGNIIKGGAVLSKDSNNTSASSSVVAAATVGPSDNNIPVEISSDSSTGEDGGGLRKCKCSKHECLGFLCGCFHARKFCSNDCTCKGCCNNRENKAMVLEARKAKDEKGCRCESETSRCANPHRCWCRKGKNKCHEGCKCGEKCKNKNRRTQKGGNEAPTGVVTIDELQIHEF